MFDVGVGMAVVDIVMVIDPSVLNDATQFQAELDWRAHAELEDKGLVYGVQCGGWSENMACKRITFFPPAPVPGHHFADHRHVVPGIGAGGKKRVERSRGTSQRRYG